MSVAKIRKGALTIPAEIRKKANLEDGTVVAVFRLPSSGTLPHEILHKLNISGNAICLLKVNCFSNLFPCFHGCFIYSRNH